MQRCVYALLFPYGKRCGKCPENQASILPASVHHGLGGGRSADKLRPQNQCSGVLFTVIDDEFALLSNSLTFKTHPRLIVDEREP